MGGRFVIAAVLLFAACGTPYQRSGFRGGFEERRLSPTRWLITVQVNSYTSRQTAVEYSYRRAAELCPGGFDPIDADRSSTDHYYRDGYGNVHNLPKSGATLVVECRQGPAEDWWCTVHEGGDGPCVRTPGQCEIERERLNSAALHGHEYGACARRDEAVCALSGCWATAAACVAAERSYRRSPNDCVLEL